MNNQIIIDSIDILLNSQISESDKVQLLSFRERLYQGVNDNDLLEIQYFLEDLGATIEAAISLVDLSRVNTSEAIDRLNAEEEMAISTLASLKENSSSGGIDEHEYLKRKRSTTSPFITPSPTKKHSKYFE